MAALRCSGWLAGSRLPRTSPASANGAVRIRLGSPAGVDPLAGRQLMLSGSADTEDAAIVLRDHLRAQVRDNTAAKTNVNAMSGARMHAAGGLPDPAVSCGPQRRAERRKALELDHRQPAGGCPAPTHPCTTTGPTFSSGSSQDREHSLGSGRGLGHLRMAHLHHWPGGGGVGIGGGCGRPGWFRLRSGEQTEQHSPRSCHDHGWSPKPQFT